MKKFLVRLLCCFVPGRKNRHRIREYFFKHQNVIESFFANNDLEQDVDIEWLGRHSYTGANFIRMHKDTKIGSFCSIGQNVSCGPSQHPYTWLSTSPFQYVDFKRLVYNQKLYKYSIKPVIVGNDVWIGNNVVIKDGVKVADGCVIGSNAVVTHDTPPYAIMAGVPARVIKYRFPNKIIKKLLELKWWDLSDEIIATLPFTDINKCIKQLEKIRKNK